MTTANQLRLAVQAPVLLGFEQAGRYTSGILAGFELVSRRCVVLVSGDVVRDGIKATLILIYMTNLNFNWGNGSDRSLLVLSR
jgi:hypothetical protein